MDHTVPIKLEITQDKLVDLLMHAATREDIASSKKELKEEITSVKQELRDEITSVKQELKEDIFTLKQELKEDISGLNSRMDKFDTRMDRLDNKIDKVIWFLLAAILVPILMRVFHL